MITTEAQRHGERILTDKKEMIFFYYNSVTMCLCG